MSSNGSHCRKPLSLILLAAILVGVGGAVRLCLSLDQGDRANALVALVVLGTSGVLALMAVILRISCQSSERATRRLNAALDAYVERGTAAARSRKLQR